MGLSKECLFTCCLSHAKSSFYRAFNAVLGKVASAASEIVVVELLKFKCLHTMVKRRTPLTKDSITRSTLYYILVQKKSFELSQQMLLMTVC